MTRPSVRALTLMLPAPPEKLLEDEEALGVAKRFAEVARREKEKAGIRTIRLALRPTRAANLTPELLAELDKLRAKLGYDYIATPALVGSAEEARRLVEALAGTELAFVGMSPAPSVDMFKAGEHYAEALVKILELDSPGLAVRLALTPKGPLETPYFPAAACTDDRAAASMALLYPSFLVERIKAGARLAEAVKEAVRGLEPAVEKIAEEAGVAYAGADISISPWMEESAIRLVMVHSKVDFTSEAGFHAVLEVNRELQEAARGLRALGYNELMLPLAEDDLLKAIVEREILRVRDFIALAAFCVAGVDLVTLPRLSPRELRRLVLDCIAVAAIKRGPMGIRLVPTREPPGSAIKLWRFGEVPVAWI